MAKSYFRELSVTENDPISLPDILNEPVVFLRILNRMLIS
jgi:hypothetical protein